MLHILYEDDQMIVVEKPIGMESQTSSGFSPDMVSELKKHINKLCPKGVEPYVGVIHRLDKPVGGVMVYAKTQQAASILSKQLQEHRIHKKYEAVICGKPVDNVDKFVDYMLKDGNTNCSRLVDKGITGAKRVELNYRVLQTLEDEITNQAISLVEVELITGRHHQIRVQFAGHGMPLWGDNRYNPIFAKAMEGKRYQIALSACELDFQHPKTGKTMNFIVKSQGIIFDKFAQYRQKS